MSILVPCLCSRKQLYWMLLTTSNTSLGRQWPMSPQNTHRSNSLIADSGKDLSFCGHENTCRERNDYYFTGMGDCRVDLFSKLLFEKSQPELQHQTRENHSKGVCSCLFKWEYSKIFLLPGPLVFMLRDILSSRKRKERTKPEPGKSGSNPLP